MSRQLKQGRSNIKGGGGEYCCKGRGSGSNKGADGSTMALPTSVGGDVHQRLGPKPVEFNRANAIDFNGH